MRRDPPVRPFRRPNGWARRVVAIAAVLPVLSGGFLPSPARAWERARGLAYPAVAQCPNRDTVCLIVSCPRRGQPSLELMLYEHGLVPGDVLTLTVDGRDWPLTLPDRRGEVYRWAITDDLAAALQGAAQASLLTDPGLRPFRVAMRGAGKAIAGVLRACGPADGTNPAASVGIASRPAAPPDAAPAPASASASPTAPAPARAPQEGGSAAATDASATNGTLAGVLVGPPSSALAEPASPAAPALPPVAAAAPSPAVPLRWNRIIDDATKADPHRATWRALTASPTRTWLDRTSGRVVAPSLPMTIEGQDYERFFLCMPHACDMFTAEVLLTPDGRTGYAAVRDDQTITYLGAPPDGVRAVLRGLFKGVR